MENARTLWDLDDAASFTSSIFTASSSSTVPGPGAITGRFLKAVGEKSLDLIVSIVVRSRLASIKQTLEQSPRILRHPANEQEWQRVAEIYADLSELCRVSRKDYHPLSIQKGAARLILDITRVTRSANPYASPTNKKWESLLASVQERLLDVDPRIIEPPESTPAVEAPESAQSAGYEVMPQIVRDEVAKSIEYRHHKIVVLGAGGVGKSTVVKQILANTLSPNWRYAGDTAFYRKAIVDAVVTSMRVVVDSLDWHTGNDGLYPHFAWSARTLEWLTTVRGVTYRGSEVGREILHSWRDWYVQESIRRARPTRMPQFAEYFLDSAERIFAPGYIPSQEDYLRVQIPTKGRYETAVTFSQPSSTWHIFDVGGENSERKKWKPFKEPVAMVLFVAALSDYNKTLQDDASVNRMQDSLRLFENIANSEWDGQDTRIVRLPILLFTKVDAFARELERSPLKKYFPNFAGQTFDDACEYFEARFLAVLAERHRGRVEIHYICAVDSQEMTEMFETVLWRNMESHALRIHFQETYEASPEDFWWDLAPDHQDNESRFMNRRKHYGPHNHM